MSEVVRTITNGVSLEDTRFFDLYHIFLSYDSDNFNGENDYVELEIYRNVFIFHRLYHHFQRNEDMPELLEPFCLGGLEVIKDKKEFEKLLSDIEYCNNKDFFFVDKELADECMDYLKNDMRHEINKKLIGKWTKEIDALRDKIDAFKRWEGKNVGMVIHEKICLSQDS